MSKKRYIVCLNSSTKEEELEFVEYLKKNNLGWWHWLPNTWLLYERNGNLKASDIRESLKNIYKGVNMLVLELSEDSDTWAGFGPNAQEKDGSNMFTWIRKNWKK